MKSVEEEFGQEYINQKEIDQIRQNLKIMEKIKPYCRAIKQENEKLVTTYKFYEFKLQRLKTVLGDIENKNKSLQIEIKNKNLLFSELRNLLVKSEIKDEYFDALDTQSLDTSQGIVCIEETLEAFEEYKKLNYDLRIVVQRQEAINDLLKAFYKRFIGFYGEMLDEFQGRSDGKVKVHTLLYEKVRKYSFIMRFMRNFAYEKFVVVCSIYQKNTKKLYCDEFEKQFSILTKIFEEKKNIKIIESLSILIESIYMLIKCETVFCSKTILIEDVVEFVDGIFKEPLGIFFTYLSIFFKTKALEVICALNLKIDVVEGLEKGMWEEIQEKIGRTNEQFRQSFIKKYNAELETRSSYKNADHCLYLLTFCNDPFVGNRIVEVTVNQLYKHENNIEEMVKRIKLVNLILRSIKNKEHWEESVNHTKNVKNKMLCDFEKESVIYIFDVPNKTVDRISLIKTWIGNDKLFLDWFKKLVFDNIDPELTRVVADVFND